jgi:hypothetical protein
MSAWLQSRQSPTSRARWVAPWAGCACPRTRWSVPLSLIQPLPGQIEALGQFRAGSFNGHQAQQKPHSFSALAYPGRMGQILSIDFLPNDSGSGNRPAVGLRTPKAPPTRITENSRPIWPIRPGVALTAISSPCPRNTTPAQIPSPGARLF